MRKTSQKFSQSHMLCKVALVAIMLVLQAMLGIGAGVLYAQKVTGTVISGSDNEPLIGASVMVQGTKVGSVTDLDGNFTIDAKNGQTLEVSYLPQFGIKKKVRNLVVSNIFRIFVVVNQIVTNNIKRLPNDYQGQSYRNILYYR